MASETAYKYSVIDMKSVINDIDEFIIPENQKACQLLWSKNIFTKMCNNYDNVDSWITIHLFSPENRELFDALSKVDEHFGKTWGGIGFRVPIRPGIGKDTYEAFKELIDLFPMQDVQKDGYMTEEEFLMDYMHCFRMVPNPNFHFLPKPKIEDYDDMVQFSRDFSAYIDSTMVPREIREFDSSKMTKSVAEYVAESRFAGLYDETEGKIFYNDIYYNGHLRYKKLNQAPHLD